LRAFIALRFAVTFHADTFFMEFDLVTGVFSAIVVFVLMGTPIRGIIHGLCTLYLPIARQRWTRCHQIV
jgi:hypothetical protein